MSEGKKKKKQTNRAECFDIFLKNSVLKLSMYLIQPVVLVIK